MRYCIYDTKGEILGMGFCPDGNESTVLIGFPDCFIIEAPADILDTTHYVDTARKEFVRKPDRPSPSHDFDFFAKSWVPNQEEAWFIARNRRDSLLKASDWMVTKALETGEPMPPGWATYRQALRDVTKQTDPLNIVWPIAPA